MFKELFADCLRATARSLFDCFAFWAIVAIWVATEPRPVRPAAFAFVALSAFALSLITWLGSFRDARLARSWRRAKQRTTAAWLRGEIYG